MICVALAACLLAGSLFAQTSIFPLKDVKPGMRAVGKTVFAGDRVEDFDVEILGVLDNIGPKQSIILARVSGGPLEKTGVLQGMSGSPVYIQGRLLGALAMGFPWAKEAIAGIRPFEEMLRVADAPGPARARAALTPLSGDLLSLFPKRQELLAGTEKMTEIATPVSFGGFTRDAVEHFAPQLRSLGLEPRQGILSGGGNTADALGDSSKLQPGSMISVQLMSGDLSIGADGTITHIDGKRLYAFGHRFLSIGSTELPFSRAEVITLLPTLSTSFKISSSKELMGFISQDRNTAILGELGRRATTVPVTMTLSRTGRRLETYRMEMVDDRLLSPLLIQMAVFSVIDATERTAGASSLLVKGSIEFQGAGPIRLNNMFAGDNGSAAQVSLSTAIPLAYVLQSGFASLKIKNIALDIESFDEKKQLQIDDVLVGRSEVRPGDTVELTMILAGENGSELVRKAHYAIPEGATPGPLCFTVADGASTNLAEYRLFTGNPQRSPDQLISTVNRLRANTKAYIRIWRPGPAFQLDGQDLPEPPASAALILSGSPNAGAISQTQNAKLGEIEIDGSGMVITGSKTIQIEVKN